MPTSPQPPPRPRETVDGLDARALLGRAAEDFALSMRVAAWMPPSVEELADLLPGYELLRLIGRGGMGAVYEARHVDSGRNVAIKLLPAEIASDEFIARRFRDEARTLAALSHPRIVAVSESGQTAAGQLYFVMEYLEGGDLATLRHTRGLSPEEAVAVASRVCEALEFAHARGIVHRDIKPANVLLDGEGHVKVGDFGLAKWFEDDAATKLTMTGASVGTPDYIAPEQLAGGEVGPRSDIFSVGVLLYEMLTGKTPRGAWDPPSRAPGVDARLDAIVNTALQPDPARRFQSAADLRAALDALALPEPKSRVRIAAWQWSLLAVVIALLGAGWWVFEKGSVSQKQELSEIIPPKPEPPVEQPFAKLWQQFDLQASTVLGTWGWANGRRGTTAVIELTQPTAAKRFEFPAHVGARPYRLSFTLLRRAPDSDAGVILQAGAARTGLILFLNGSSGLGLVKFRRWDSNLSTRIEEVPAGAPQRVEVTVRPSGEDVQIAVMLENQPFIEWSGPQRDLTLFDHPQRGWTLRDPEALGFATYRGGIGISDVRVELLK